MTKVEWVDLKPEVAKDLLLGYSRHQIGEGPGQMPLVAWESWITYFRLNDDPDIMQKLNELNSPVKRRKKRVK